MSVPTLCIEPRSLRSIAAKATTDVQHQRRIGLCYTQDRHPCTSLPTDLERSLIPARTPTGISSSLLQYDCGIRSRKCPSLRSVYEHQAHTRITYGRHHPLGIVPCRGMTTLHIRRRKEPFRPEMLKSLNKWQCLDYIIILLISSGSKNQNFMKFFIISVRHALRPLCDI